MGDPVALPDIGGPPGGSRGGPLAGPPCFATARYHGVPRRLVLCHKERGRRDLAPALGSVLARAITRLPGELTAADGVLWLVPAPSRRSAARLRGGPHMLALVRHCAALLAAEGRAVAVAPALRLARGVRDGAGLDAVARAANLAGAVHGVAAGLPPAGTPVVLVDDVVTSGATARACAEVLGGLGVPVRAVLALTSPSYSRRIE